MALLIPVDDLSDLMNADRRRHPAIYGEAPSSNQLGPDPTASRYLAELLESANGSASMRIEQAYSSLGDQLSSLKMLESGWDSYSAPKPSDSAINATEQALQDLRRLYAEPAAVMPSADGGVGICFVKGRRLAQVEFLNNGEAHALMYGGEGSPQAWQVPLERTDGIKQTWMTISAYLQS